jgi:hypothetical protein
MNTVQVRTRLRMNNHIRSIGQQTNQETDMFTRTTFLALASVAAFGAALITSTSSADAGGFGRRHFAKSFHHHGHFHRHHHYRHSYHYGYRPYIYGGGAAAIAAPAYAVAAPTARTCLTKEYTADKLVVFKDLCTKEMVAAPLRGAPQAAAQPQAAPQPGEVEPEDDAAATK